MKLETINVADILRNHGDYEWVHQGIGFLRTYLDEEKKFRLHLWHPEIQVPGISYIHTHRWDFTSRIVSGGLINKQFMAELDPSGPYVRESINLAGEVTSRQRCNLHNFKQNLYLHSRLFRKDDIYFEAAETVHTIQLVSKCISVIERDFVEPKFVYSFRPVKEQWANVAARPASEKELDYYIPQFKELLCES